MSPIGPRTTCLDWILDLKAPVILVTGTYLGAISHTLTALHVLRGSGAAISGIVVSESAMSAGLDDTVESIYQFGGRNLPLLVLPRLSGLRSGSNGAPRPPLAALCLHDPDNRLNLTCAHPTRPHESIRTGMNRDSRTSGCRIVR